MYVCVYVYINGEIISRAIRCCKRSDFNTYRDIHICMYVCVYVCINREIISRAIRCRKRSDCYTYMDIYSEIRSRFSDLAGDLNSIPTHEYVYVCMYVSMYIYRERSDLAHMYICRERSDLEFEILREI